MDLELQLIRSQSLPKQIATHVRQRIRDGRWRTGEQIPPAKKLARLWGTDPATVHRALSSIAREGLVERKPHVGTFVCYHQPTLETVGIYVAARHLRPEASVFVQCLIDELQMELIRQGMEPRFLVDTRRGDEQGTVLPELARAIELRELQAVISPVTSNLLLAWQEKLTVPVAYLSSRGHDPLTIDHGQFVELAVTTLARQGCRRLGLVGAYSPESGDLYERFIDGVADAGLLTRDGWIIAATAGQFASQRSDHARFGYESVKRMWAEAERPDGLIVTPDGVTTGAVMALMELGVRAPDDVRLVLQRNTGIPLPCPFQADYLCLDTPAVAAALVQQLQDQHAGRSVAVTRVRHSLSSSQEG